MVASLVNKYHEPAQPIFTLCLDTPEPLLIVNLTLVLPSVAVLVFNVKVEADVVEPLVLPPLLIVFNVTFELPSPLLTVYVLKKVYIWNYFISYNYL